MLRRIVLGCVRAYQLTLSVWVGRECRFQPTCSNYCIDAVQRHGVFKGLFLTVGRLLRCHPFGASGYDPVPKTFRWRCFCGCVDKQDKKDEPVLFRIPK